MKCFINLFLSSIFVIYLLFLSFTTQLSNEKLIPDEVQCLQKRPEQIEKLLGCEEFNRNFCNMIRCEPLESLKERCKEDENTAIVQNMTGRGCCPGCVRYIEEDKPCEVGSKLNRCRNGLFCNPSTRTCNLPPKPMRCMQEVYNRRFAQKYGISFYIMGTSKVLDPKKPIYFEFIYANNMEYPDCAPQSGEYVPKQCRGTKCFCVEPKTGKTTHGLTIRMSADGSADNVTCGCSEHFRKMEKGLTQEKGQDVVRATMEHNSQIHSKCDSVGNYEKLQCINTTCFCVDEQTGRPKDNKVANFGALLSLPCFDKEKSKALGSKEADVYYLNECERQLMNSQKITLHFKDKGTQIIGLDKMSCSYDGRFAPKQCKQDQCNCVKPDDAELAMPSLFQTDKSGNKDLEMECQCARQNFFAEKEKRGYDGLQCDALGNYKPYQSFDNGMTTFCVDENGSPISEKVSSICLEHFINDVETKLGNQIQTVCKAMAQVLTEEKFDPYTFYAFDPRDSNIVKIEKPAPEQLFYSYTDREECRTPPIPIVT